MSEPETSGWSRLATGTAWVLGGLALGGAVFVASFFVAMRMSMRSSEVTVPDLAGLTREEAERTARPLALEIQVVDRRHDAAVASGRVLQQDPTAGASVRHGRRVKVVLSLGGEILRVPDLLGKGLRATEIDLKRAGLTAVREARAFSGAIEAGGGIAQVPPAGSPAVSGTRVHRLVSEGPLAARWVMPNLVGRPREAAERWIESLGFRRGPVRVVASASGAPGTVVGQLPLAGYPIGSRGVVELSVAR